MKCVALATLLSLSVLSANGQRGHESCHDAAQKLDECYDRLERSQDYRDLKSKEKEILKQCIQQNQGTACTIGSGAGEKCRKDARREASLKSAKEAMYSAIDQCFDGKVANPFAVLRMTGDMGMTAKKRRGGGGGGSSSGGSSSDPIVPDTSDFSPSGSDSSSGSSSSGGAAQNCPPAPLDPSTALGGSSTDLSGASGVSDPSSLISGLGAGGLPAGLSGGLPGAGGLPGLPGAGGAAGGLPDISSLFAGLGGGRRKRQAEIESACKPIFDCVKEGKKKYQGDRTLSRAASKVYREINRCKAENSPSLSCIPSSKDQKKCVGAARKDYQAKLKTFISTCMSQSNLPNGQ